MSSQSNTSVHWKTMYRKKNLCVESVVTLFLLRLVVVLLEFFFPKKNDKFVNISIMKQVSNKRNYFLLQCHWLWLFKLVEHTMFDMKVTLRSSIYCYFCWFFTDKANFFSFLGYLPRHSVQHCLDLD